MACNLCAVADVVAVLYVPLLPADAVEEVELLVSCERCDDRRDALLDVARARRRGQKEQQVCWSHFTNLAPLRMRSSAACSYDLTTAPP